MVESRWGFALRVLRPRHPTRQGEDDVSFSFIHTGDLHLDSPLAGLAGLGDERAAALASASRRAFDDLVDLAVERRVDAFLIAGDLWDGDWSDVSAGLHVQAQVARLARHDIRTFAVLGNHDAMSRVTDRIRDIDGLHLFPADRPASVECGPAVIHGMSYARPDVTDNIAALYPEAAPGRINIGLLHTALDGKLGHDPYAPCSLADLHARRYHYWALGHVHTRQILCEGSAAEGGTVAYCGVLQGRHVKETGVKGAFHGRVEGDRVHLTELDLRHAAWFVAEADVSDGDEKAAMRAAFRKVVAEAGPAADLLAVRVRLTGRTRRHFALATSRAALVEAARFAAEAVDGRIVVEEVRLETAPPDDAPRPALPHGFEALLAHAAADPAVLAAAKTKVAEILNELNTDARGHLAEVAPDVATLHDAGDLVPLMEAAAARVAARLETEEG